MLPTSHLRPQIIRAAADHALDPRLVEAVVLEESSGNPWAFRYEPAKHDGSFGLMQVMGQTARALGLAPKQRDASLCDPVLGLEYGCRALAALLHPADLEAGAYKVLPTPLPPDVRIAIARYNGGGAGNPNPDNSLRNESYVQAVEGWLAKVQKEAA